MKPQLCFFFLKTFSSCYSVSTETVMYSLACVCVCVCVYIQQSLYHSRHIAVLYWQKHFAWEAPSYISLYDKGKFDWMVNVSTLKKLISTSGFVVKFMDITTFYFEPTEGNNNV